MQNNSIGNVAVATARRSASLKSKSSDLHTTMDFGSVMPGKVQKIIGGSSFKVSQRERVVLTSLVAPCFGKISLKSYSNFLPIGDIYRNYDAIDAQEPVYRNGTSFVPQHEPCVSIQMLSFLVLIGAHMSIYRIETAAAGTPGQSSLLSLYQIPSNLQFNSAKNSLPQDCQTAISDLNLDFNGNLFGFTNAARIVLTQLLGLTGAGTTPLYLSNPTFASYFDYRSEHPNEKGDGRDFVSLEGADYMIPVTIEYATGSYRHYMLAFRLSSFGRRLRKNLIGCGWQFDINNDTPFSILPLMAFYKSYFDVFGLTLYQNWEETYAYQVMSYVDNIAQPVINPWASNANEHRAFLNFILYEFGCTYWTTEQDFVSAHVRKTGVSPNPSALLQSIDTDVFQNNLGQQVVNIDASNVTRNEPVVNNTNPNGHAYIDGVQHGQLDSNLLKKLYRQTNVNTIAGRKIADLLRAQGFGAYVDECKSNFIGSWELDLPIYDLPNQSDTYNKTSTDGMRLGEFGAFGKASNSHKPVDYKTDKTGYYINLLVIVPKGGYSETIDPDAVSIEKYQHYNSEFDSLGMEFSPKYLVHGSMPVATSPVIDGNACGSLKDSFGLVPRYFSRKFGRNVVNGDFSLRSTRATYQPWCLERLIEVGEKSFSSGIQGTGKMSWYMQNAMEPIDLPIAGNVWRQPTRYEWISRYNRIFYNETSSFDPFGMTSYLLSNDPQKFEYFGLRDDNFILHMIYDMPVYDEMLPVQDSFETSDDENHADSSMGKA